MMGNVRKNHPVMMIHEFGRLLRNSFFFFVLLFIINEGSDSWYVTYGRHALLFFFTLSLVMIPLKWLMFTYSLRKTSLQVTKRFLTSSKRTVPYTNIRQIRRTTHWYHRFFRVTSLRLEMNVSEEDAILFPAIKQEEAKELERMIHNQGKEEETDHEEAGCASSVEKDYTIHFSPQKKDLIKAALTSSSIFVLIPLLGSFLSKVENLPLDDQVEGILSLILDTAGVWGIAIFLICGTISGSVIHTLWKYGKYEVSSNDTVIRVRKGRMEKNQFSIEKRKVEALVIEQTLMKRFTGVASLKLVCAGGEAEEEEVNSLYPFLPVSRMNQFVEDMLPGHRFSGNLNRLPRSAMMWRLFKPSWVWLIVTLLLFWFKPQLYGFNEAWWIISLGLLILLTISRVLEYKHYGFTINNNFIQLEKGGFTKKNYLSRRDKVIEMKVEQNSVQRLLGLASLVTMNRATPVHSVDIKDVPESWVTSTYRWYRKSGS